MSAPGPARITLDDRGRIRAISEAAAVLLDAPPGHLLGLDLGPLLDPDGEAWLRRRLADGGRGLEERAVRTRTGRFLRLEAADEGVFHLSDDTARAALGRVARLRACDAARADLAGAVARELNDPMAIVQGRLELLLELGGAVDAPENRHLRVALLHARRVSATLHLLRLVGRPPSVHPGRCRVDDLLAMASEALDRPQPPARIEPEDLAVFGETELLRQVLTLLLTRAHEAAGRGQPIRVRAVQDGARAQVQITAASPGEDPGAALDTGHATAEPWLEGGLAATVLARVGGHLEGGRVGRALVLRMTLPSGPVLAEGPGEVGALLVIGRHLGGLDTLLAAQGFEVQRCTDAEAALDHLENHTVGGVVARLDLPGLSGLSLVRRIAERWPALARRAVLLAEDIPDHVPDGVTACPLPIDLASVLRGLGHASA